MLLKQYRFKDTLTHVLGGSSRNKELKFIFRIQKILSNGSSGVSCQIIVTVLF